MAVFVFQHGPISCNDPFINVQAQSLCVCVSLGVGNTVYVGAHSPVYICS